MKRKVVVTGMGVISPIGNSPAEFWTALQNQKCGIDFIQAFDTKEYKVKLAAEVRDFHPDQWLRPREIKFNDRFTQFARIACMQAMEDAGLRTAAFDRTRMGVLFASGIGGISTIESCHQILEERGPGRVSPYFIPMALSNLAAGQIAIDHGAQGYVSCPVSACAAGANAIGDAFLRIQSGMEDVMLAGGAEAGITPLALAGFQAMHALHTGENPQKASVPFDESRSGFVMGEGAGALVLEERSHALERGARIYGEIEGYGFSCDACHITAPHPQGEGAILAMKKALHSAGLKAKDIQYINAHGTSTPLNDLSEAKAIAAVFSREACPAVSSTKASTGHLLGAAGAVEAIACLLALNAQFIPPTIHTETVDPKIAPFHLDLVCGSGRVASIEHVMSNSLGFGGHNVCLIFKKEETA